MASTPAMRLARVLRSSQLAQPMRRLPTVQLRTACRAYSTDAEDAPPPLLSKLKGDLKTAMRAKDAPRLQVLRAVISANLNASKTSSPIRTDAQLVGLLRKLQQAGKDSMADAKAAGREDLVEKEQQQISILDEYVASSGVQSLGEAELKAMVQDAIDASKSAGTATKSIMGDVMKRMAGALEGKDVDRKALGKMVGEMTKQ